MGSVFGTVLSTVFGTVFGTISRSIFGIITKINRYETLLFGLLFCGDYWTLGNIFVMSAVIRNNNKSVVFLLPKSMIDLSIVLSSTYMHFLILIIHAYFSRVSSSNVKLYVK